MNALKLCPKCGTMLHPITEGEIQSQSGGFDIKHAISILSSEGHVTLKQVDFANLEKVMKSSEYSELPVQTQEIVYNHIQDLIPEQQKELNKIMGNAKSASMRSHRVYLICPMRDYITPIPDRMIIKDKYIKGSQVDKTYEPNQYATYNKTLPITRDHVCSRGKDCVAIKKGVASKFAFFRRPSGRVMHVCIDCCKISVKKIVASA